MLTRPARCLLCVTIIHQTKKRKEHLTVDHCAWTEEQEGSQQQNRQILLHPDTEYAAFEEGEEDAGEAVGEAIAEGEEGEGEAADAGALPESQAAPQGEDAPMGDPEGEDDE